MLHRVALAYDAWTVCGLQSELPWLPAFRSCEDTVVPARGKVCVKTGLQIAIPRGTYARIAPRSGLAAKHFIDTGAGVVDEDYRGEVLVLLFNHSETDFPGASRSLACCSPYVAAQSQHAPRKVCTFHVCNQALRNTPTVTVAFAACSLSQSKHQQPSKQVGHASLILESSSEAQVLTLASEREAVQLSCARRCLRACKHTQQQT
jgi:hypothetical protein